MRHTLSPPFHRRKTHRKTHRKTPSSSSSSSDPPDDQSSTAPSLSAPDNEVESLAESLPESQPNSSQFTSNSPQLTPYINIVPLPTFTGSPGECPVTHLARFDRACRANNATALETVFRIFPASLDGHAALWYDLEAKPHEGILSWPEIRAEFLKAFTPPDFADRARTELLSMKIKDFETVNSYHLRIQWILKRWPEHGFTDTLLKGIFVDGLSDDYKDWIVPRQPETLAEAVRLALGWERARNVRGGHEVKCGFCEGEHEERGCEVRRGMKELWMRSKDGAIAAGIAGFSGVSTTKSMKRGGQQNCQCWRHQCWKRSVSCVSDDNSNANVTTTSANE